MINSVVILGGGTAGLISALMMRHAMPGIKVSVVESSKIGIIGVGEGSTEHWKLFMDYVGITVYDIISQTGATFKNGIKFTNWNGDGKVYYHAIGEGLSKLDTRTGTHPLMMYCAAHNTPAESTVWPDLLENVFRPLYDESVNQYHFDTNKLNQFFHKLAEERGVEFYDDDIKDVVLDQEGFVESIVGTKMSYSADFFIDSSGFNRVISTKLGAKWISRQDQLPMNSALAFPTPRTEDIPAYTESTAMSSGWIWRIPTQERYGNGYVFCDDFINKDQALAEAEQHYGYSLDVARDIKFSAGYVDKFWIKNCISLGLAGMFVEPLEATSIGSTIQQMFSCVNSLQLWHKHDTGYAKRYNEEFRAVADNIIDFVQVHYVTKRQDSEFWRWVNSNITLTDFNKEHLPTFKKHGVGHAVFNDHYKMFKALNFYQVLHGLEFFDVQSLKKQWDKHFWYTEELADASRKIFNNDPRKLSHRDTINYILNKNYPIEHHLKLADMLR